MSRVALVLAAGAGKRFGGGKLAALFRGEPLIVHALRAARAAPVDRVLVVCAPGLVLGDWPGGPEVERLDMASHALSTSLRAGVAACAGADAVYVFLGDMPLVPSDMATRLAEALGGRYAAVPVCHGQQGHPVLLSRRALADIDSLSGDRGAGLLLRGRPDVARVETGDAGVLADIDRPGDLARFAN